MKTYELIIQINDGGKTLQKKASVNAENTGELAQKIASLEVLSQRLDHEDFLLAVELINEKPELIPEIKEMLQEGENMSEAQLLFRTPVYVKRIIKILKS